MPTIVRRSSAIVFALIAMVINATANAQGPASTLPVYSSPALDSLIAAAAAINARIPDQLRAYRAQIETEMSLALLDSADQERTGQLEQIASDVRWRAVDRYDQRVIGYRSQSIGPSLSLLSIFGGWTTPTLYGNQLQLGVMPNTSLKLPRNTAVTGLSIHPLSADRARSGVHAAWAGASSDAARRALLDLGTRRDATGATEPLSRPTDGIRASAEVLLTVFSGAISVGVTRPIDRRGPWKLTGRGGQGF